MSRSAPSPELPLLLAGVPAATEEWVRLAGLPVAPFRTGATMARHVRPRSGQIVLFDSRNASSRFDAQTARDCGLKTVNVATLFVMRPAAPLNDETQDQPPQQRQHAGRAAFLDRLKRAIEGLGGLWIRIADFPWPYQDADWTESPPIDGRARPASRGLTWLTTAAELERWRRVRRRLAVRVRLHGGAYYVSCDEEFSGFRPMLELWRGSHVARLPLLPGETVLPESGIAFQHERHRHPAGLAATDETIPSDLTPRVTGGDDQP